MLKLLLSFVYLAAIIHVPIISVNSLSAPKQPLEDALAARTDAEVKAFAGKGFSDAVLVAGNNRIILNKTYANAADSGKEPAFWIASNSKSCVAAAIPKLQEQKKLAVNDPLAKFFKDVPTSVKSRALQKQVQ